MTEPWSYWKQVLSRRSLEAFEDEMADGTPWSADEVFDYIVRYEGGLASGHDVRRLVQEVYSVELGGK